MSYWQHGQPLMKPSAINGTLTISCNGQTHVSESATTPYVRVDSAKFYEIGQVIAGSDSVTLRLRDSATKVLPAKWVSVHSQRGISNPQGVRYAANANS